MQIEEGGDINIAVSTCINFERISTKQTTLKKQGLVNIFLYIFARFTSIFAC